MADPSESQRVLGSPSKSLQSQQVLTNPSKSQQKFVDLCKYLPVKS